LLWKAEQVHSHELTTGRTFGINQATGHEFTTIITGLTSLQAGKLIRR
jgi:hypothetical protein